LTKSNRTPKLHASLNPEAVPMRSRRVRPAALLLLAALLAAACGASPQDEADTDTDGRAAADFPWTSAGDAPEATSLSGEPLFAPDIADERRARLEADVDAARAEYERNPNDADAIIWLGRRVAYLGRYREAIETFGRGVELHPDDARMYRHRGHRYITVRDFDAAIRDLERAAELIRGTPDEVEPDGAPNRFNIPVSTLHSNIWYHLALAHYLKHDFERALPAWREAMKVSDNDDMVVATSDWLYMTLRRLGRDDEARAVLAPIHADMRILENDAYHQRLLMYKGEKSPDDLMQTDTGDAVQLATYGYGVANWYFYNGQRDRAGELFRRITDGANWAAFGFIAAEVEIARGNAR
jgi:tetratricopeptide (TPR) repeat protein